MPGQEWSNSDDDLRWSSLLTACHRRSGLSETAETKLDRYCFFCNWGLWHLTLRPQICSSIYFCPALRFHYARSSYGFPIPRKSEAGTGRTDRQTGCNAKCAPGKAAYNDALMFMVIATRWPQGRGANKNQHC